MQHLIITDIFGLTPALKDIAHTLPQPCHIFDPYNGKDMRFVNEAEAYTYFMGETGLRQYAEKLVLFTQSLNCQLRVIAFSVGASALWDICHKEEVDNIVSATCFYGSQIRYNRSQCPIFPIELIFPAYEEHFSVKSLIADLLDTKNVSIQQVAHLHGFMNKYSNNYNGTGYREWSEILRNSSS